MRALEGVVVGKVLAPQAIGTRALDIVRQRGQLQGLISPGIEAQQPFHGVLGMPRILRYR